MPPDMTPSFESKGPLPTDEAAAAARAKVELRQLVWSFWLASALIAGPVGIATMIAHWIQPLR